MKKLVTVGEIVTSKLNCIVARTSKAIVKHLLELGYKPYKSNKYGDDGWAAMLLGGSFTEQITVYVRQRSSNRRKSDVTVELRIRPDTPKYHDDALSRTVKLQNKIVEEILGIQ